MWLIIGHICIKNLIPSSYYLQQTYCLRLSTKISHCFESIIHVQLNSHTNSSCKTTLVGKGFDSKKVLQFSKTAKIKRMKIFHLSLKIINTSLKSCVVNGQLWYHPSFLQQHRGPFDFVAFPFCSKVLPPLSPSRLFDIHDVHEHN